MSTELTPQQESELADYLDGVASAAQEQRVREALRNDPDLNTLACGMLADREALRSLPRVPAPRDVGDYVLEHAERGSLLGAPGATLGPPRTHWFLGRSVIAAAALLLVGVFAYFVWQQVYPGKAFDDGQHFIVTPVATLPPTGGRTGRPSVPAMGRSTRRRPQILAMAKPRLARASPPLVHPALPTLHAAIATRVPSVAYTPAAAPNPQACHITVVADNAADRQRLMMLLNAFSAENQMRSAPQRASLFTNTPAKAQRLFSVPKAALRRPQELAGVMKKHVAAHNKTNHDANSILEPPSARSLAGKSRKRSAASGILLSGSSTTSARHTAEPNPAAAAGDRAGPNKKVPASAAGSAGGETGASTRAHRIARKSRASKARAQVAFRRSGPAQGRARTAPAGPRPAGQARSAVAAAPPTKQVIHAQLTAKQIAEIVLNFKLRGLTMRQAKMAAVVAPLLPNAHAAAPAPAQKSLPGRRNHAAVAAQFYAHQAMTAHAAPPAAPVAKSSLFNAPHGKIACTITILTRQGAAARHGAASPATPAPKANPH